MDKQVISSASHHAHEEWWDSDEVSGSVPIQQVAPLADQPRQYIDPDERETLEVSIKSSSTHNPLIVTPRHRAPWARVEEEYAHAYFVTVSGHRRLATNALLGVSEVPVIIRHYENEREFRRALNIANIQGVPLTPVEQAFDELEKRYAA